MSRETAQAPILSWAEASALVDKVRSGGASVVFTNGCFDIIHPGHVEILAKSAAYGDFLVVGLNSDQSVKRLKGRERPVNSLGSRAAVLASIRFVDCVVPFEEDTPGDLIRLLKPDVLVKGGDYTLETVVGARDVIRRGGKVEIVPLLEGFSTTAIIRSTGR